MLKTYQSQARTIKRFFFTLKRGHKPETFVCFFFNTFDTFWYFFTVYHLISYSTPYLLSAWVLISLEGLGGLSPMELYALTQILYVTNFRRLVMLAVVWWGGTNNTFGPGSRRHTGKARLCLLRRFILRSHLTGNGRSSRWTYKKKRIT